MTKKQPANDPSTRDYEEFEKLARRIVSVPKREVDKKQAEHDRKKAAKKRAVA